MLALFVEEYLRSGALISLGTQRLAIGWGKQQWLKTPTDFSFYFPDFFLGSEKPWLIFEHQRETTIEELLALLKPAPRVPKLSWKPADQLLFEWQCADLFQRMERGELQKGVPYASEKSETPFTPAHCHSSLIACLEKAQQKPLAVYGFWNEHEGMLGATPELLFRQAGDTVETCAVAGTLTPKQEIDHKLKVEHEIVVRAIVEALSPYGKVTASQTGLIPFSHLAHLKTPIELHAKCSFEALVEALHPTPALGAFPKKPGALWLQEVQRLLDRRRYGAPAGLKRGEEGHCFVAIRNVQWNSTEGLLSAGCGFVAESDVEQEWQELQMKLKAMKEILGLVNA